MFNKKATLSLIGLISISHLQLNAFEVEKRNIGTIKVWTIKTKPEEYVRTSEQNWYDPKRYDDVYTITIDQDIAGLRVLQYSKTKGMSKKIFLREKKDWLSTSYDLVLGNEKHLEFDTNGINLNYRIDVLTGAVIPLKDVLKQYFDYKFHSEQKPYIKDAYNNQQHGKPKGEYLFKVSAMVRRTKNKIDNLFSGKDYTGARQGNVFFFIPDKGMGNEITIMQIPDDIMNFILNYRK